MSDPILCACDTGEFCSDVTAFSVGECEVLADGAAKRNVKWSWADPDLARCDLHAHLPEHPAWVPCEKVPSASLPGMAALTMCCAAVAFNASILAWIISRRRTNLALQLAQPTALALMTFGGIVTSSGIGWLIGDNRQINCVMRPATLAIGFSLGFGAIWLKLRRVEAVCAHEAALIAHTRRRAAPEGGGGGPDKPPAKPASTTEKRLLQLLGLIVLGDLAILGLWFAIDPSVPTDTMRDVHGIAVPAVECVGGANPFQGMLWAYKVCRAAARRKDVDLS